MRRCFNHEIRTIEASVEICVDHVLQTEYHEEALRGVNQAHYEPSGLDGLLQYMEAPIAT